MGEREKRERCMDKVLLMGLNTLKREREREREREEGRREKVERERERERERGGGKGAKSVLSWGESILW